MFLLKLSKESAESCSGVHTEALFKLSDAACMFVLVMHNKTPPRTELRVHNTGVSVRQQPCQRPRLFDQLRCRPRPGQPLLYSYIHRRAPRSRIFLLALALHFRFVVLARHVRRRHVARLPLPHQ